jgi:hypothetical protein
MNNQTSAPRSAKSGCGAIIVDPITQFSLEGQSLNVRNRRKLGGFSGGKVGTKSGRRTPSSARPIDVAPEKLWL